MNRIDWFICTEILNVKDFRKLTPLNVNRQLTGALKRLSVYAMPENETTSVLNWNVIRQVYWGKEDTDKVSFLKGLI